MALFQVFQGLSLVEVMIFGFIGANFALAGSYVLQVSMKRRTGAADTQL